MPTDRTMTTSTDSASMTDITQASGTNNLIDSDNRQLISMTTSLQFSDEEPTEQEGNKDQPPAQEQATTSTSTNQLQSKLAQHCAQVLGLKPAVLEFDHLRQLARQSHATAGRSNFSTASKQTLQAQETIFREGVLAIYTDLKGVDRRTNEDTRKKIQPCKKIAAAVLENCTLSLLRKTFKLVYQVQSHVLKQQV